MPPDVPGGKPFEEAGIISKYDGKSQYPIR
jgi:hypothetical protein